MTEKEVPPVDRSKRCMLSGNPETPEHRELRSDGMQKDYVVLYQRGMMAECGATTECA